MGCNTNCTKGLFPIKWDKKLNVFSLNTEVTLIVKCCPKKRIKNSPESAIANLRAMEVVIIFFGLS
jgi:hypothetical protein